MTDAESEFSLPLGGGTSSELYDGSSLNFVVARSHTRSTFWQCAPS